MLQQLLTKAEHWNPTYITISSVPNKKLRPATVYEARSCGQSKQARERDAITHPNGLRGARSQINDWGKRSRQTRPRGAAIRVQPAVRSPLNTALPKCPLIDLRITRSARSLPSPMNKLGIPALRVDYYTPHQCDPIPDLLHGICELTRVHLDQTVVAASVRR